ncbi:AraC family transcriptional regulator [Paenibacillus thalictri]|nr:AraC family transcriptional regulator [Paenibacillus thalictri]
MLCLSSVHFDNRIPNWRKDIGATDTNVLALVLEGKVRYTLAGKSFILEKGELLFFPNGVIRAGENVEEDHQKITVLFRHEEEDAQQLPLLNAEPYVKCKIRKFEYMKRRFERLFYETVGDGKFQPWVVNGIFNEIVGIASREFESVEIAPSKQKLAGELQEYLVSHYRQPVNIEQVAALIHRSPNYTISLFREVTGLSPIQYVHQLRMKEACSMLSNSDLTVTEISNYLGYYDHSYFFRMFKKHTGVSPTEYRQSGTTPQAAFLNIN